MKLFLNLPPYDVPEVIIIEEPEEVEAPTFPTDEELDD